MNKSAFCSAVVLAANLACGPITGVDDYVIGDQGSGGSETGSGEGASGNAGNSGGEDPQLNAVCAAKPAFDVCFECCTATYPDERNALNLLWGSHCGCRQGSPCLNLCAGEPMCVSNEFTASEACGDCVTDAISTTECFSGAVLECEQTPACAPFLNCANGCPSST